MHVGDMRAQVAQALDNLEAVLGNAGFKLSDVVRLNYYTTDIDQFFEAHEVVLKCLAEASCRPTPHTAGGSALGLSRAPKSHKTGGLQ